MKLETLNGTPGDAQHQQRAGEAERHRHQDRARPAKASELRHQQQQHRAEGESQDAEELAEGGLLAGVLAADLERDTRRQRHPRHGGADVAHDTAQAASAGAAGDGDVGPEILAGSSLALPLSRTSPSWAERQPAGGADDRDALDGVAGEPNAVGKPRANRHQPVGLASGAGIAPRTAHPAPAPRPPRS